MNAPADICLSRRHTAVSRDAVELAEIFDPEIQLAIWERPRIQPVSEYLANLALRPGHSFRTILKAGETPELSCLPDASGRDAMASDMRLQAELFGDLLGCPLVGLRVEIVQQAMCPRFHVDQVGIRLLCTYRGPGTQWLDDTRVDRSRFWPGRSPTDPPSGDGEAESVAPFAVALLKGSLWQGNGRRGVIHRSPAVPTALAPRVVIAMDAVW